MTDLIWLDDAGCLDARICGDKAARLARARGHGFPVLPGFVIPASAGHQVLEQAVSTTTSGLFGARLTVMDADVAALTPAIEAARQLGSSVVVRSSSPVEGSGRWAGAFSSFVGVPPDDLPTAVRGVWSSAIIDRPADDPADPVSAAAFAAGTAAESAADTPRHVEMAVLVQPEVMPVLSGTARVETDGSVSVVSTTGAPAALVSGWVRGTMSRVDRTGSVQGDETNPAHRAIVGQVGALAAALRDATGDDVLEWAALGSDTAGDASGPSAPGVVLLQCRQDEASEPPQQERPAGVPGLLPVARVAHAFAGPLGEQLVLPWLLAAGQVADALGRPDTPPVSGESAAPASLAEQWRRIVAGAADLAAIAWPAEPGAAAATRQLLRDLQGPAPDTALAALATQPVPDTDAARHLLADLAQLADALVRRGVLRSAGDLWLLEPDEVTRLAAGTQPGEFDLAQRARRAALRWEPLLFAALVEDGETITGTPASPGIGAGPCFVADAADPSAHPPARCVVVARHPLPRFAPLLWSASGLVTLEGSAGAHLIEVARSLGVPAVVDCASAGSLTDSRLAAVDGEAGTVSFDVR